MNPLEILGRRLRRAREKTGMTLQEVAAKTSISVERLGAIEAGAEEPSINEACDLALQYGVSLDWLASPDGDGKSSHGGHDAGSTNPRFEDPENQQEEGERTPTESLQRLGAGPPSEEGWTRAAWQRYPLGKTAAVVFLAMLLTAAAAISTVVLWPESGKRTFAADTLRYGPALLILTNEKEPEETRRKRAMFRAFILMRNAIQALQTVRDQEGEAASHASSLLATLRETLLGPRLLDDQKGMWRHRLHDSLEPDIKLITAGVDSDAVARRQSVAEQVELGILALKTVRKEDGAIAKHARSYFKKLRTKLSN